MQNSLRRPNGRALRIALVAFVAGSLAAPLALAQQAPSVPPAAKKSGPFHGGVPDTPKKRAKLLQDLYAHLASATSADEANKAAQAIERLWHASGSDTVSVLMERAASAANEKNFDLAMKMLDTVVEIAPDYVEGWNRRAYVNYLRDDIGRAMADLRRALALDPNHFKALDGLAQILKELGDKKAAFQVYQKLIDVHPFWQPAEQAIRELGRDVEGQGI